MSPTSIKCSLSALLNAEHEKWTAEELRAAALGALHHIRFYIILFSDGGKYGELLRKNHLKPILKNQPYQYLMYIHIFSDFFEIFLIGLHRVYTKTNQQQVGFFLMTLYRKKEKTSLEVLRVHVMHQYLGI
ncbi:hypothetical protein ACJX0J_006690, partial [Zea mays]